MHCVFLHVYITVSAHKASKLHDWTFLIVYVQTGSLLFCMVLAGE